MSFFFYESLKEVNKINGNMQIDNVKEITDKLEGSLSIGTGKMDIYERYKQEGKEAALGGNLNRALELFQKAYQLQPSDKLKKRVQAIQELVQREEEEEEEDDFVNVNGCGLNLYKGLYDKLYDHQKEGVAFLYTLHRDGRKGGILADDMGLGKTIQVISFLSGMYDAELANHTLLVMPTSLIKNWVREFAKWTPGMRVKEFHGSSKAERNRNLERIQRKGGVVITTYQMLINNYEQLGTFDNREFRWDYVILDEAHKIKTSSTKTAKSAHAIPARHRVLLTGTPVQNNLREMWALFDFACQGSLLGTSKTFKTEYENPITRAREKDATPGEKALGLRISQNLMDIIKPYFLRRTKADVQHKKEKRCDVGDQDKEDQENRCPNADGGAEMPSLTRKNDLIVWTYLSSVQEEIYNQFLSLDRIKELLMTTRSPLAELTVLKKLCDHPRLLSARAVTQLGLEQGCDSTDPDDESESAVSQIDRISDETLIGESGKLVFLVSLMECLREEGHRTLIFSQSRKMLDIMERVLRNRGFRLLRLDGTVTQLAEREKRITLFQTDRRYSIFLLTTQVGGVGITLTAANRVVIFDPSWNPATDAQAVDRAYRIGQTENVIIYRLITCGTVEEKIYRRQVFKDSLIRQTTGDKKNPFRYFSKQELRELFTLEDTRSSSTQQQLQAMHSQHRRSDTKLDHHIAQLYAMEMFGISDHDLMFTKEPAADEDDPENAESHQYIQTRVQKAQELMQAESELHGQLMDSVAQNTEPAWLRQSGQRGIQTSAGRDRPAPPRAKHEPVTVDLTHYSIDEPEFEKEEMQNSLSAEEVQVVGEDEEEDVSLWSAGEKNSSAMKTHVNPANDSQPVILLDDEYDDNTASEQQNSEHGLSNHSHQFSKLEEVSVVSDPLDTEKDLYVVSDPLDTEKDLYVVSDPLDTEKDLSVVSDPLDTEKDLSVVSDPLDTEKDLSVVSDPLDTEKDLSVESDPLDTEKDLSVESDPLDTEKDLSVESDPLDTEKDLSVVSDPLDTEKDLSVVSDPLDTEKDLSVVSDPLDTEKDLSVVSDPLDTEKDLSVVSDPLDTDKAQTEAPHSIVLSSPPSPVDSPKTGVELLQGNFNLQLEDSADMFSAEEEAVYEEEESGADDSPGFQLQMDVSGERLGEPSIHNSRRISNYNDSNVSKHKSPVRQHSAFGTPADESFLHSVQRRKKMQIISDSEEDEEEEELERPCLSSSPLVDGRSKLGSSTPKYAVTDNTRLRRSLNTSVASRRSFVMSVLDNESDEESAEPSEGENESYQISEASETHAEESLMEEEEPSGETLNTDECDEEEEPEESLETTEEHQEESTADVELESSEMMDQCAPKTNALSVETISNEAPAKAPENTYESLVLSGKRCLADGRKQEALDYFLKAIDLNIGDAEIQLLIIQLYRQLSQPGQ